jgi:hypothetical protein
MHTGMLLGSPVLTALAQSVGANIGNLTAGDGLAGAFDGNLSTYAYAPDWNLTHCIGKKWPSPIVLKRLYAVSGPNGFSSASQATNHDVFIEGSNDTTTGVDGVWAQLYSTNITNTFGSQMRLDVSNAQGLIVTTAYLAHRLRFVVTNPDGYSFQGSHAVAELTFYAITML